MTSRRPNLFGELRNDEGGWCAIAFKNYGGGYGGDRAARLPSHPFKGELKVKFSPSTPSTPNLSASLRPKRLEMGLTLAQLAKLIGIHPLTLRSWESGETTPRPQNRIQLSKLLGGDCSV